MAECASLLRPTIKPLLIRQKAERGLGTHGKSGLFVISFNLHFEICNLHFAMTNSVFFVVSKDSDLSAEPPLLLHAQLPGRLVQDLGREVLVPYDPDANPDIGLIVAEVFHPDPDVLVVTQLPL